jgi:hypothetical protein
MSHADLDPKWRDLLEQRKHKIEELQAANAEMSRELVALRGARSEDMEKILAMLSEATGESVVEQQAPDRVRQLLSELGRAQSQLSVLRPALKALL